ncbi:MAG: DNRLRE domain-containing protein, partial [Candidatus Thermoplasmatota archaeon]|nr:DNRLRE domain-containing protein [Candidatus Thermoplasmatota archaeon]
MTPADNASIWSEDSPLPSAPDYINFQITSSITNESAWNICRGNDLRWLICESSNQLPPTYSWDNANMIFNYTDSQEITNDAGDYWQYWRVRADQGYRIGEYSPIHKYRISPDVGYSDGNQNYTIEFYENSIFDSTGSVPLVNDGGIDSLDPTNTGNDAALNVGYNSQSGGISDALYQFDLSQVPFPQTATPTSLILQLTLQSRSPNSNPITISAHECDLFDESTLDFSTKPVCSTNELTRTTITGITGNTVNWDLTGLGQRNFQANNHTFSVMLSVVGQNQESEQFFTSESNIGKPKLIIEYLENPNSIQVPSQVSLNQPLDGTVLYDTSNYLLEAGQLNSLSWNPVTSATSYRLYITNSTTTTVFDSNFDSEISGNTFTPSVPFAAGETYIWSVQAINQYIPGPKSQSWTFGIG